MKRDLMKKAAPLALACLCAGSSVAQAETKDNFYWLGQINKASIVINTRQGLLSEEQGKTFAAGLQKVLQEGEAPGAARPGLVITFEHAGRSSQDMLTTCSLVRQREASLKLADALAEVRSSLLELAERYPDMVLPNYTNGVAAQPNSYAHYLLAYARSKGVNRRYSSRP